jgi:phage terminase large subunit-like protein
MDRFTDYISYALAPDTIISKYSRLAVERHVRDMDRQRSAAFPYYFDPDEAQVVIDFVEDLRHYQGKWAGQPVTLEPWQVFIIGSVYGWRRVSDGGRRFRKTFVFVARKNGKTLLASALQLYDLLTEPGAEIYSIATDTAQAKKSFDNVVNFIKKNDELSGLLSIYESKNGAVVFEETASKLRPLSSKWAAMDGYFPQFVLADETSSHRDSRLIGVMESGMDARTNPLMFQITTAQHNLDNPGRWDWERSRKILDGKFYDETYFTILYELDDADDWTNPENYIKANPNLGVSVQLEKLQDALTEAIQQPTSEAEFKTKRLNIWLKNSIQTGWITEETWKKVKQPLDHPADAQAVGALDLSKRHDWTAFTVYFYAAGKFYARHWAFIPEEQIEIKMQRDTELVLHWINEGLIIPTPGPVINHSVIKDSIRRVRQQYPALDEVVFDAWQADDIVQELKDELQMVEMGMKLKDFSEPAKRWEADIIAGKIADPSPVMDWHVGNVQIYTDINGNIKPIKIDERKSSKRIDLVITSIMAHSRLTAKLKGPRRPKVNPADISY